MQLSITNNTMVKKPCKNWKHLFKAFLKENVVSHAQRNDDGLSCFLMGFYHEEGFIVPQDYEKALEYFKLGANKRDPFCLYKLYEIYSGNSIYEVSPDKELALLYLIWSVMFLLPVYGSHICMDFDLNLQTVYKDYIKQNKTSIHSLIDQYEDDIFGHDKELVKCVFDFLIRYISPTSGNFNAQEAYDKMIDRLIALSKKGDTNFTILFLFKSVLWEFQNVTNRNQKKVLNVIRQKKCSRLIYQNLRTVFDYLNLVHEKHPVFAKFLRFDSIEVFWQIKYSSTIEDFPNRDEACAYVASTLYNHLYLIETNVTKFIAMDLMAKCYEYGMGIEKDLVKALDILQNSRNFAGFAEDDFAYMRTGRLYEKLGDIAMSQKCYQKYFSYSHSKRDLPIKFFRQGRYYELYEKNFEKAIETFIKGLKAPTEFYTFQLEFYSLKCKRRIEKIIDKDETLRHKFDSQLQTLGFFKRDV